MSITAGTSRGTAGQRDQHIPAGDGRRGIRDRWPAVMTVASATASLGWPAVRWKLDSGRWQRPCRGVLITHSGPVGEEEALWVAVLGAGRQAVLSGLTAARLDGLAGFKDHRIHVIVPATRRVRAHLPGVLVHRSRVLGPDDIHPVRLPSRTRIARSLLNAAAWMGTDNGARAVLAAGVQQRLLRPGDLAVVDLTVSGHRVLRFPAFAVRDNPAVVATPIKAALQLASRS